MADDYLRADVTLNAQARIVIPAEFRKALGFKPGDDLIMYIEDGGIRIDTAENIIRRVQDEFARVAADKDLVAMLLEERREQARRFDEKYPWPDDETDASRKAKSA